MGVPLITTSRGCPPQSCSNTPLVRYVTGQLDPDTYSPGGPYIDMTNVKNWILAYDLTTVPWNQAAGYFFSSPSDTTGTFRGYGGGSLPGFTRINDEAAAQYNYQYARCQVLFRFPTNYLLICGFTAGGPTGGTADEGCYGTYGGACGIMEIPWSVIPGYNDVWLYIQGPVQPDSQVFYPDLTTCVDALWVPADSGTSPKTGPDWNPSQDCGSPVHNNDPYGDQFEAP